MNHVVSLRTAGVGLVVIGMGLLACKKGESGTGGSASAAASAAPAPALKIDAEAQKLLAAIVAKCKVDEDDGDIDSCPDEESRKLFEYARDKKPPNVVETLAEAAVKAGEQDKKTRGAAVAMLSWMARECDRDWLKQNSTPAAAERVLKLAGTLPESFWMSGADACAAIPALGGRAVELAAELDKRSPNENFPSSVVAWMLEYGGSAVLPVLESLTKSKAEKMRNAATRAADVANASTSKLPEAERTRACDWAKGFIGNADPQVAGGALGAMTRCKGAYLDAALDALEKRMGSGPLDETLAQLPHHACWAEGVVGGSVNGTPEQCKRALGLSAKAAETPSLKGEPLRLIVWGIAQIAQNGNLRTEGKALLQKLASHPEKVAADAAREGLGKL
jgi:hypothetical protein